MCISVGWLFFFFVLFLFFLFFKKKVVPTKQWGFFFFSVGLTVNHRGSGFTISQTIRGGNTPLHTRIHSNPNPLAHIGTPGVRKHAYYTHETWCRHTHTHTKHTFKFRKATRTKGGKKGLFLFTNILTLVLQMWHTLTSTDSKIHKPSTWMRHWSRTMLHTLGTAKGLETKCKYCTLWYISRG